MSGIPAKQMHYWMNRKKIYTCMDVAHFSFNRKFQNGKNGTKFSCLASSLKTETGLKNRLSMESPS